MPQKRNQDPMFDAEQIEEQDPLGEQAFAESGFSDDEQGEPQLEAPGLTDDRADKQPEREAQKVAGIPESKQKVPNTASEQRPDSGRVLIRERGGESKGDPAAGGTRPK